MNTTPTTESRRILVADDEPTIALSLEFLMRRSGFETRVARDGDEALATVGSFRPHLVLLDVMLPRRNGLEVCRTLRSTGSIDLKIVLLTAKGGQVDQERGLSMGADLYVVKPFSTQDLMGQVKRLLS